MLFLSFRAIPLQAITHIHLTAKHNPFQQVSPSTNMILWIVLQTLTPLVFALGISMWLAPDLFKRLKGDSFRKAGLRAIVATVCEVVGTVMGTIEIYAIGA